MDIARPDLLEKKKKRQLVWAGSAAAVVVLLTLGSRASSRRPRPSSARPSASTRSSAGEMLRDVRGSRHARARGHPLDPGAHRRARRAPRAAAGHRGQARHGDPGAQQPGASSCRRMDADSQAARRRGALHRAQGAAAEPAARPEGGGRPRRGRVEQARLRADADAELAQEGPDRRHHAQALAERSRRARATATKIEQQRLAIAGEAIEAQLAVQQADVEQRRAQARAAALAGRRAASCAPASTACCSRCRSRWASA